MVTAFFLQPASQTVDAPAPAASADPVVEPNAATIGTMHTCGSASTPMLVFSSVGVVLAMGTAVALLLTKRPEVARWAAMLNLFVAASVVLLSSHTGGACVVLGVAFASLPFLLAIASFGVSAVRGRNKAGPEADSG